MPRAPQTGRGSLPTDSAPPAAPPSLLPPGRGVGGDDPPPPTRVPTPDPPPDLPPERGEERRERGRREGGGGPPPGPASRPFARPHGCAPPPWKGGGAQTVRIGLSGIIVVGRRGGSPPPSLLPQGNRIQESANGRPYLPGAPRRTELPRTDPETPAAPVFRAGPLRTIPDYPGQRRAEITPKIPPRSAARRRKSLKTRSLLKPLRMRAHRSDGPHAAIARPCRTPCLRLRERCRSARGA